MTGPMHTELVRRGPSPRRADQILALWAAHGALPDDVARQRLGEVVCVVVDDADAVVGVCSVYLDRPDDLGSRPFWMYRRFTAPGVSVETGDELFVTAFECLEAEAGWGSGAAGADTPVGLCMLVDDEVGLARRELIWTSPGLLYAGRTPDGSQLRVRYFDAARVA